MQHTKMSFESQCIHDKNKAFTSLPHQLPIYATSSFEFETYQEVSAVFKGEKYGHVYSRYGNPTMDSVAQKIANLEAYSLDLDAFGLLTSSGMSAISTLLLTICESGSTLITQENLYGGSTELLKKVISKVGAEIIFTNLYDLNKTEDLLKQGEISVMYLETPANPTLACIDFEAICSLARKYKVTTVVDNTFCTPYLQQPFSYGIDYVIHSTTKYLNGHGNAISGIIVGRDKSRYEEIWKTLKLVGSNSSAFDAWLLNNGIKTLSLRMDRHSSNATRLATMLHDHEAVSYVNYLSLDTHPDHSLAKRQMRDFGGMLSFVVKDGFDAATAFMNNLQFCTIAPTLGDVDTLVVHPASMSHMNVPKEVRDRNGIVDGLIRISVGIENINDIRNDVEQALG